MKRDPAATPVDMRIIRMQSEILGCLQSFIDYTNGSRFHSMADIAKAAGSLVRRASAKKGKT